MTDNTQPEALMQLADAYAEASFDQGLHKRTLDDAPENARSVLAAAVRSQHARITELESQLAQRFDAADVATAAASGFRDGLASVSAGSEPVAFNGGMTVAELSIELDAGFAAQNYCRAKWGAARGHSEWRRYHDAFVAGYLAAPHPSPTEGMAGWISVKDRLPEKNTEVLICFAEASIPSTGQYTARALDHEGWCYPQENLLWPGEHPDFEDGGSPTVTHWMPLPAAPGPADGESNG